jgi:PAS domain S-box-containing protein
VSELRRELEELGVDITAALDELPIPAALLDSHGVVRWQNGAGKAFRGDRVGEGFAEVIAPGELEKTQQVFTEILCRGEPAEFTMRLRNASGAMVPAEISSVPLRRDGAVVGVFGVAHLLAEPSGEGARQGSEDVLTPRQLEVLQLLAQGASTHDIAAKLHLTGTTVRNHVANILAALGAHTRLQAVLKGQCSPATRITAARVKCRQPSPVRRDTNGSFFHG